MGKVIHKSTLTMKFIVGSIFVILGLQSIELHNLQEQNDKLKGELLSTQENDVKETFRWCRLDTDIKNLKKDMDYQQYLNNTNKENIDTLFNNLWKDSDHFTKIDKEIARLENFQKQSIETQVLTTKVLNEHETKIEDNSIVMFKLHDANGLRISNLERIMEKENVKENKQ